MNKYNLPLRTIWRTSHGQVKIIDQTHLPHHLIISEIDSLEEAVKAIKEMKVRGAPLIGVTASFGLALAMSEDSSDSGLSQAYQYLLKTRPTAMNLSWALDQMMSILIKLPNSERKKSAFLFAEEMIRRDVLTCRKIGEHGADLILKTKQKRKINRTINILTHCNAGWLAAIEWGTALAPIYVANELGYDIHVWVDETRPRNQGSALTAWELSQKNIPHTIIVDNAGGHLIQEGLVDMCIVGADRVSSSGDVCNKIGTYLKALAAKDNKVPFYAAIPFSTVDWSISNGMRDTPIEERGQDEVLNIVGLSDDGKIRRVALAPEHSQAANYSFDVTPARLLTGLITEDGIFSASKSGLNNFRKGHK